MARYRREKPWVRKSTLLACFALLILLNYALPYTILTEIPSMHGAFLFWIVLTLLVILFAIVLSARWRDGR